MGEGQSVVSVRVVSVRVVSVRVASFEHFKRERDGRERGVRVVSVSVVSVRQSMRDVRVSSQAGEFSSEHRTCEAEVTMSIIS